MQRLARSHGGMWQELPHVGWFALLRHTSCRLASKDTIGTEEEHSCKIKKGPVFGAPEWVLEIV